ncbi:transcriptional antiterminator RfaH [Kushneria sinocarnis]|uniref:Transcriptional antiterminator RfaH n=1 Tax=Kushneria sinocarnis TaxID=595502 RepID=A0A420WYU0_9GAMM|nr:transcription/translation regulatory transformer protein RfaH [Kushneria sinocarnis]RKR06305.1 transcriptional antiterminator RfaH [Kushneria sinocarnis]
MSTADIEQPRWYAIQCKGGESFRAAEHLTRQGYQLFHPVIDIERRQRGRIRTVREPLFPWYLFIRLDRLSDNWRPIRSTRGVLKLVAFGNEPTPIPDELIDTLRHHARSVDEEGREHYFRPGDRIEITEGPFREMEGVFFDRKGEERVIVLLNILQREHQMQFSIGQVRRSL